MRKQYHFRRSATGDGFDAWDVDRLVELSRGLQVERVPLSAIHEVDEVYWFDGVNPPTVRAVIEHMHLVREVDPQYPILLGCDGRLMDGMHRVVRAIPEGQTEIEARRFNEDPEPDYRNCQPEDLPY